MRLPRPSEAQILKERGRLNFWATALKFCTTTYFLKIFKWYLYNIFIFPLVSDLEKMQKNDMSRLQWLLHNSILFYIKSKQLLGFPWFTPVFPTWNLNFMVFYIDFWHILGFPWFSPPDIITLYCFILSQSNCWVFPGFPQFSPPEILILWCFTLIIGIFWVFPGFPHLIS